MMKKLHGKAMDDRSRCLSHYGQYGSCCPIAGAVTKAGRMQSKSHFVEAFAHGSARESVWQQSTQRSANTLRGELILHQLGYDIPLGNQVHHGESVHL